MCKNVYSKDFFLWPPYSLMNFYDSRMRLEDSAKGRRIDIWDYLVLHWNGKTKTAYLGISTKSEKWKTWNKSNISRLEELIKYDLEFDGDKVSIHRISKIANQPCVNEFIWKLKIRSL